MPPSRYMLWRNARADRARARRRIRRLGREASERRERAARLAWAERHSARERKIAALPDPDR